MKLLAVAVIVIGLWHVSMAKGGRGGGGYRGGSYRGSSSRSSSGYRATNVRTWSSSTKAKAIVMGSVFISHRARMRYGFSDYDDDKYDLEICRNSEKFPSFNGSTTSYGWFVCPLNETSNTHCCGDDGRQYCCPYWTSPSGISAIVGIVFGITAFLIILGIVLVCLIIPHFIKSSRNPTPSIGYVHNAPNTGPTVTTQNIDPNVDNMPPPYSPYGYANSTGSTAYTTKQYPLYPPISSVAPSA